MKKQTSRINAIENEELQELEMKLRDEVSGRNMKVNFIRDEVKKNLNESEIVYNQIVDELKNGYEKKLFDLENLHIRETSNIKETGLKLEQQIKEESRFEIDKLKESINYVKSKYANSDIDKVEKY